MIYPKNPILLLQALTLRDRLYTAYRLKVRERADRESAFTSPATSLASVMQQVSWNGVSRVSLEGPSSYMVRLYTTVDDRNHALP